MDLEAVPLKEGVEEKDWELLKHCVHICPWVLVTVNLS